jgi:hypothetical protein
VIRVENTMGMIKRYRQLTTVIAAKLNASVQSVVRMPARVPAGRLPSCHANTAANRRNTDTKNPDPTKKSQ